MKKKNVSTHEIARYCGVSYTTALKWVENCQIRSFKMPGDEPDIQIEANEFMRYLQDSQIPIPNEFQSLFRRVLIVEDDLNLAHSIQRTLKKAKFETQVALDAFQAGMMVGSFKPDVITLDLKIPGFGGVNVLKYVRSFPIFTDIKILVVSGMPMQELEAARTAGADDILQKPYDETILVEKIRKLIEIKN